MQWCAPARFRRIHQDGARIIRWRASFIRHDAEGRRNSRCFLRTYIAGSTCVLVGVHFRRLKDDSKLFQCGVLHADSVNCQPQGTTPTRSVGRRGRADRGRGPGSSMMQNKLGETPVFTAAVHGDAAAVSLLFEAKHIADRRKGDDGRGHLARPSTLHH
eukprot:2482044-Rhodomonas_salina.2